MRPDLKEHLNFDKSVLVLCASRLEMLLMANN